MLLKHLLNTYILCSKQVLNVSLQAMSSPILGKAARRSPARLHSPAGKETSLEMRAWTETLSRHRKLEGVLGTGFLEYGKGAYKGVF